MAAATRGVVKTYNAGVVKTYNAGVVKTYNAGVVTRGRRIGSWATRCVVSFYSAGVVNSYSTSVVNSYSTSVVNSYSAGLVTHDCRIGSGLQNVAEAYTFPDQKGGNGGFGDSYKKSDFLCLAMGVGGGSNFWRFLINGVIGIY
jgi:hypothetical protein